MEDLDGIQVQVRGLRIELEALEQADAWRMEAWKHGLLETLKGGGGLIHECFQK